MLLCFLFPTAELTDNSTKQEIYGLNLPIFAVGVATYPIEFSSAVQILVPKFLVCTIPLKGGKSTTLQHHHALSLYALSK